MGPLHFFIVFTAQMGSFTCIFCDGSAWAWLNICMFDSFSGVILDKHVYKNLKIWDIQDILILCENLIIRWINNLGKM